MYEYTETHQVHCPLIKRQDARGVALRVWTDTTPRGANLLHLITLDKAGQGQTINHFIIEASNIDVLIGALQRVKAGPLGRMALDATDRSDHD